jgi:hypothetical protein
MYNNAIPTYHRGERNYGTGYDMMRRIDELEAENARLRSVRNFGGGRKPSPVVIRGVEYASAKDAAKHLGVSVHTVKWARQNGKLDIVGIGKGFRSPEARAAHGEKVRAEIHFQDTVFDGWAQAVHITGMSRNTLSRKGAKVICRAKAEAKS